MLETPHVAVGAAIAVKTGNPALAIPIALGSHFVLELVPHWNPHILTEFKKHGKITAKSTKIIIADSLLALTLGLFIASRYSNNLYLASTILATCFFAIVPDLVSAPFFFLKVKNKFIEKTWLPFKKSLQEDVGIIPGLITQVVVVVSALWWII